MNWVVNIGVGSAKTVNHGRSSRQDGDRVRLLVTGVPGWLTNAFLEDVSRSPLVGVADVRGLAQSPDGPSVDLPFEIVIGDLRDPIGLERAVRGVDVVLHAAGILHVKRTTDWYAVNATGTKNLLDASRRASVRRFVLISSNAAVGRASSALEPLTETDRPRPLSHYGRSKLLAEQFVRAAANDLETVVLRPCMFYGPPVPQRHVDVYRRVANGRMPLVGHGRFARSVTYIDHLVDACRRALTRHEAVGQTFFISDARVYTTRLIVEAMAGALGVQARFVPLPALAAPLAYWLDTGLASVGVYWQNLHLLGEADWHVGVSSDKAQRLLGYAPSIDLAEGMRRAIDWCRANGMLPA